jgi:outer membrane receptor protein involved in Fe transport
MNSNLLGILLIALCSTLARSARADEPTLDMEDLKKLSPEELGEIPVSVVSAREESNADTPGTVIVITEEQIRQRGYLDLMDIFQDLPGFDVSPYNRALVPTEVAVRGMDVAYNKITVLRDGIPIQAPAAGPRFDRNQPLHDIARIEVLYGPASVVYGSDAAAAVISLISKEVEQGGHAQAGVNAGTFDPRKGTDQYVGEGHVFGSWRQDKFAVRGSFRTYQSSGPNLMNLYPNDYAALQTAPAPYTARFEAPIRGYNAEAALYWRELQVGVQYSDHEWPSALGQNPAPPFAYLPTNDAAFRYHLIQPFVRHDVQSGLWDFHTSVLYSNMQTDTSAAVNFVGQHYDQFRQQESIRLDHRTAWHPIERLTVTAGVRLQTFNIVPLNYTLSAPVTTGETDLTRLGLGHVIYTREGGFLLADLQLWKTAKATAGLAVEYDTKSEQTVLLPRGGIVQRLFGGAASLKAFYGEGYQAAIPDLQYLTLNTPVLVLLPNPNLAAERIRSVELRYEHRYKKLFSGEIGGYYNRVTGTQQLVPLGPMTVDGVAHFASVQAQNSGLMWSTGCEVSARAMPWAWLQVAASYAYVVGEETVAMSANEQRRFDLAKVARHKLLAEVTVKPFWKLVANARLRWIGDVGTRYTNSQFAGQPMPGYTVLNVNLRAEDVVRGLDLHVLVENVADSRYYTFGSGTEGQTAMARVPQPGARFMLGATYKF